MSQVIVVGAGPGGLAAAARLAVQGHRVTVLRPPEPAWWLWTFRRDGFAFDVGASGLTLPAVYRDLFLKTARRRSGAALEEHVELRALDPSVECRWSDGTTALLPGTNPKRVAATLGRALGGSAEADWRALCARGSEAWTGQRPGAAVPVPGQPARRWLGRTRPPPSLAAVGRELLADPRLRSLLDHYATRRGVAAAAAPSAVVAVPYVEQAFGTWHVMGGIGALVDALIDRGRELDVDVREDVDVVSVTAVPDGVTGVRCADGASLPADAVVVDRPVLGADRETTLLLALREGPARPAPTTLLLPAGPGDDAATLTVRSPDDPTMHPAGHEAWSVRVSRVDGSGHDPAALLDDTLDRLDEAGLDVRSRLLWASTTPPVGAGPLHLPPPKPVAGLHVVGRDLPGSALPYLGLPYAGMEAERVAAALGRA